MKLAWKIFGSLTLVLVLGILMTRMQGSAAAQSATPDQTVQSSEAVTPVLSRPVRDIVPAKAPVLNREINPMLNPHRFSPDLGIPGSQTTSQDPLAALSKLETGNTPAPLLQFEGLGTDGFTPPDTVGDVGPSHYIQMVNISIQIFDKAGTTIGPKFAITDLFTGSGLNACASENDGDPIVVYDELADRWLLSQFAVSSGERMCIAISQTPDPTGAYYLYQFNMPDFPDYFKFGVWPDAYYMSTNTGSPNQYYAYAFDRVKMLAGAPATFQFSNNHPNFMMPADLDGSTPPPAGSPGYFYTMLAQGYPDHPAGVDRLAFYEFDVDWVTPANSTFTLAQEIPVADYNYTVCGFFVQNCIPQPGTGQTLDSLSYWPMFRFAYRNLGSYEALVGNFTVDLDGTDKAAIRWFELRDSGGGWGLQQEGTHAPDGDHRWMGSIAMDGSGNIALGYSVSSGSTIPAIRYATRLASDPAGTLQAEQTVISGGVQNGGATRWGDYSAMSVDPADDCTFWYTTEYHDVSASAFNWNTRVVSFKIPECSGGLFPDFTVQATPNNYEVCSTTTSVDYNVSVGSIMSYTNDVTLSVLGNPSGTTTNFTVNPVTPGNSSVLTIGSLGSAVAGSYNIDIVGTVTNSHTATVGLDLYTAAPGTVTLSAPADGATGVGLAPTLSWSADAIATNYYVEVATDMAFSNIVFTDTVASTSVNLSGLGANTTYYWRVTADNICGAGATSAIFSFTTATLYCGSTGALPDDPDQQFTLNISDAGEITDLDLSINANHTWVGDMIFTLVHQDTGTSVTVIDRPGTTGTGAGCSANDVDVLLNDEGADGPVESQCAGTPPALFGSPTPNNPLSAFDGEDLSGTWLLNYVDGAGGDTGTLNEWCLVPTVNSLANDVTVSAVTTAQNADAGTAVTYTVDIENTGSVSDTYDVAVVSSEGWTATVDPTSVTLDVAESTSVEVTVMVPAAAAGGTVDTATVTATSQSAPAANDAVDLLTTVNDPAIEVNPTELEATVALSNTVDQTLTISNIGGSNLDWEITEVAALSNLVHNNNGIQQRLQLGTPQPNLNFVANLADIIQDGSFEGGSPNATWAEASTNFGSPLCTIAGCGTGTGTGPRTGAWWAWFGGIGAFEEGSLSQSVTIPTGTATLTFYVEAIICASPTDFLEVTVDGTQVYLLDGTSPLCTQLGYTQETVDLSAYADGNAHTIAFHSINNSTGSNFFVDDVVLDSVEGVPACTPNDIPWLSVASLTGTTAVGGSDDVTITYDATGYAAGVYTGTLCIDSNDPVTPQITVPVTMTVVEPVYGLSHTANLTAEADAGQTVTYTISVTNTGNAADTYDIALSGETWGTTASVASMSLGAGETGEMTVSVVIPAGAAPLDSDTVTVEITSQGDAAVTGSLTLTTTVAVPPVTSSGIFLPFIMKP